MLRPKSFADKVNLLATRSCMPKPAYTCGNASTSIFQRPVVTLLAAVILILMTSGRCSASPKPSSIAILGDSMTWIGGQECDCPDSYTYYLKRAGIADTLMIFARSGATWTNDSTTTVNPKGYTEVLDSDNVIYNQALRLLEYCQSHKQPDKIIIYAGANDAWFGDRRPGLNVISTSFPEIDPSSTLPSTMTTLQNSIFLTVELLRRDLPQAEIILATPVEMGKVETEKVTEVADIIERTGNMLGVPVLRADRFVPIRHEEETEGNLKNTKDGVHTNPEGAKLIADFLTTCLKNETIYNR